ncbi:magnesium-transporting ATPase (P-type) [Deinococcus sp. UYEF24]
MSNRLLWLILGLTFALLLITLFFGPARQLFGFAPVSAGWFGWCTLAALASVGWVEIYKAVMSTRRTPTPRPEHRKPE